MKLEKTENKNLDYKVKEAMRIMREYAPKGEIYYLAYSGGKDSDVLLHIARRAGINFQAIHNYTSIEDKLQRKHVFKQKGVKVIYPKKTMFQLIEKKGLPTRLKRWCCSWLKHDYGKGKITMTGVRKAESAARNNRITEYLEHGGKSKRVKIRTVNPILNWTDVDIWKYIENNNIETCSLYKMGYKRVGCVGCPLTSIKQRQIEFERNKGVAKGIIKSMSKYINNNDIYFEDGQDAFNWWMSGKSVKQWQFEKEMKSFDFDDEYLLSKVLEKKKPKLLEIEND